MAAFFLVRDLNPERRRRGIEAAAAAMRRFDLEFGSDTQGAVSLAWGFPPGAPLDRAPGVFVMGDLITDSGSARMSAATYLEHTRTHGVPPACDGFHYAATFDPHGALTIAVDLAGLFALYYATIGDAVVAASSPALIAAYPGFTRKPDPLGITALLATNGGLRGRTLVSGIRRLTVGHVLVAAPGGEPREIPVFAIEPHSGSHDVPGEECVRRFYEAFCEAAKRHVPREVPHTMMFSGGLDSRLIIGVLAAQGVPFNAITQGAPDELEWKCARTVGKHLGIEHHLLPIPRETWSGFERLIEWTGLSTSPGTGGDGIGERVPHVRPFVVTGIAADNVFGGYTTSKSYDKDARTMSVEAYVRSVNPWGVPWALLPGLLRRDVFGESLQTVLGELREDYWAAADTHMARSWLHSMHMRQRFVLAKHSSILAFTAWPRMPHLDRRVIHTCAGIPLPLLTGRQVEIEMVKRFHADLARLPLDRNDLDTTPLLPRALDLVRAGIDRRIRRVREQLGIPRGEKRHYHVTYDFNGPAWRDIRLHAEADRERVYDYFERDAYDALVPRAEERWNASGVIGDASATKMLLAFGTWLRLTDGAAPAHGS